MKPRAGINPFAVAGGGKENGNLPGLKRRFFEIDLLTNEPKSQLGHTAESIVSGNRIKIWTVVIICSLIFLAGRAFQLQIIQGNYFRAIAEGNRIRIRDIKATRGVIYDRNKNLLVENIPSFALAVIPVDLSKKSEEKQALLRELSAITGLPKENLDKTLAAQSVYSYQPIVISENLSQDQAILTELLAGRYPGVILQTDNTRHYLYSSTTPSLSHLLGYEGKIEESKLQEYLADGYFIDDYVGKAGLELSYEKQLKGVNGREQVEVDATGKAKEIIASQKPVSGNNLVLALDNNLQKEAEKSLISGLRAAGKKRGAVVVLNANSGEILALISLPAYNNNSFSRGISAQDFSELINNANQPLYSRAVTGEYPSGSTFKLVIGAAGLQEGIINESTRFLSTGGIYVDKWFFPDWKAGGHGWTNINKALADSVNTYFYIVGGGYKEFNGLGVEKIKKYAEMFGLGRPLGVDLPQEGSGFLPSQEWKERAKKEMWYIGDTYHLAIGQGDILVTPLQVAAYTSIIANGGTLYRPHLVSEILNSENETIKKIQPEILNKNFIDPEYISIIQRGLRQAVLTGSAKGLGGMSVTVAAKTGTAEWSKNKQPQAWLTAFAPYENPEIVVTVLIEEGGEGSRVSLPVARDIISYWAANRQK